MICNQVSHRTYHRILLCTQLIIAGIFILTCVIPSEAKPQAQKKLSLAELAALEWKLEQAAGRLDKSPSVDTRKKAIAELATIEDPRVIKPLAIALREDPDPSVRLEAVNVLAKTKTPEIKGLLTLASTADPDEKVRTASNEALKTFPKKMELAKLPIKPSPFSVPKEKITPEIVTKTLTLPSGDARLWAIEQMEKVKIKTQDILLKNHLQKDPSARVRLKAAQILAKIQKEKSLPTLIATVTDADPTFRFGLARILSNFEDKGALLVLQKIAESDENQTVKSEARELLEPFTPIGKKLFNERIAKLISSNPVERIESLQALAKFTNWKAMVPMSCALINDKSELVRGAAADALSDLHDMSVLTALRVSAVIEPEKKLQDKVRSIVQNLRKNVDALIKQLNSKDPNERVLAARALGQAAYPQGLEPLIKTAKDKEVKIRRAVIEALLNFRGEKAQQVLKLAGGDSDGEIRKTVDDYFRKIDKVNGWRKFYKDNNRLVMKTTDNDPIWRADAAIALGVAGAETAVNNLISLLLKDKEEKVRLAAAWALVLMASDDGTRALKMAASNDKSEKVRLTARKYLIIDKVSIPDLIEQLIDQNPSVRTDAAEALSLRASRETLPHLVRAAMCDSNAEARAASLRGLARIGDPMAKATIEMVRQRDSDQNVRRAALVMHILAGGN